MHKTFTTEVRWLMSGILQPYRQLGLLQEHSDLQELPAKPAGGMQWKPISLQVLADPLQSHEAQACGDFASLPLFTKLRAAPLHA